MAKHIEDDHQKSLVSWAKVRRLPSAENVQAEAKVIDYLYAIPNGGTRNKREAGRLKLQGVKSGVSDLHLALPLNGKSGLWIEMKQPDRKKARVTPLQKEWIERMLLAGYEAHVCYGYQEAKQVIENYIAA
jgi:hypothetical protein